MKQVDEILSQIVALGIPNPTILVAIDGCGGAGKSFLAKRLVHDLRSLSCRAEVIQFDDFYLPSELRPTGGIDEQPIGGSFDWLRLREQVLVPLRTGRDAVYARYDWTTDSLAENLTVSSGVIVFVEGVHAIRDELAPLYDLRIWVDCPRDVRLCRGIERDGEERRAQWVEEWIPMEDRYVEEHRPHEKADILVSGTTS